MLGWFHDRRHVQNTYGTHVFYGRSTFFFSVFQPILICLYLLLYALDGTFILFSLFFSYYLPSFSVFSTWPLILSLLFNPSLYPTPLPPLSQARHWGGCARGATETQTRCHAALFTQSADHDAATHSPVPCLLLSLWLYFFGRRVFVFRCFITCVKKKL